MIETALLAMAALSCYFLLYSDEFSDLLFTSLFGVSIGLGLLTKLTYLVYIIGPVCYVIFLMAIGVMRGSLPIRECIWRFCRLLPSVTVGLLLAGLWYGPNYANFTANLQSVVSLDTIGHNRWDVDSSLYYLNTIIVKNIGLPFFVLFAFGFWRTAQSLKPSHFWFLSIWGLSIYVILSLQTLKHDLMIMGVLFPVCIVSAIGISNLSRWKTAVGSLVLIFGISQFITLSLPEDWLAARIGKAGRFSWAGRYAIFPAKEDWKIREALSRIVEENAHAKIGVVSDHMFINGTTIKLYAELMGVPSEVTFCHSIYRSKKRDIRSFEYIIAKSDIEWVPRDVPGDYCITSRDQYRIVLNQLEAGSLNFELFAKYPLPDATEMLVYKQRTNGASVSSASWKTKTGG